MTGPDLRILGKALAAFLLSTQRELHKRAATGQITSVAIHADADKVFRLGEWPRDRGTAVPAARVALFAATAAASFKAARDFDLLDDDDAAATARPASERERALDVAALEVLAEVLAEVVEEARTAGPRELLEQAESALDRSIQIAMRGRSALGSTVIPPSAFPIAPGFSVHAVFRERSSTAGKYSGDVPASHALREHHTAAREIARRRVILLLGAMAALLVVGVMELRYFAALGRPPPPRPVDEISLAAAFTGSSMLPREREDFETVARVSVGSGWGGLATDERRGAIFALCQVLGGHSYQSAIFTDLDGDTVARWTATKIELSPP